MATIVKTLDHLKECAIVEQSDFWIRLNGGAKSSKDIKYYEDGSWGVFHYIDDSFCEYENDKDFIEDEDFIIKAIKTNNLIWENYE